MVWLPESDRVSAGFFESAGWARDGWARTLDTGGEPACCSLHLLVMSPGAATDEPPYQDCHVISEHDNFGFGNIDFDKLSAAYDPKKGLLLTFGYIVSNGDDVQKPGTAKIRLNLAKGTVVTEK